MGGGGGTTTQYVKSDTSNLPSYAQPYYTSMMGKAQAATSTPYTPYSEQRLAGFTPEQTAVQQQIAGQQLPGQFGQGSQLAAASGLGSLMGGQYDTGQFGTQQFDQNAAQQYMSPYTQNVLDVQKAQAIRDAQQGQLAANLGAARQGTYGGARQLLAGTERERNLGTQLGSIEATGLQNAYQSAQQQFNTEQQAQHAAATAEEQSRQFGANLGLQGYAQANQAAQTLGNLGATQQQTQQSMLAQQQGAAAQQQALQQQYLDQQYQDFINQRDYPLQQLQQYSSLLRGVPVQPNTTTTVSAPAPSLGAQLMGTGLTALSAYNMAKG